MIGNISNDKSHKSEYGGADEIRIVIVRGNPGVQNLNPYPTLHKPLPLVKGKGFEGSG